ncbi:MAG: glycoside hydrolase family 32 protein [Roseiflexaceae bacterium]
MPTPLHYHLMHPGGPSLPGDPNAAFCIDGVYHLHYIVAQPWQGGESFAFVHVSSPDMLHWTWHPTTLQPDFTGHGMFSGTGFETLDGQPAIIYHGQGSGRNQIVVANDRQLTGWQAPYPVDVRNRDGSVADITHWDPDCFVIDGTYYAISGGEKPPLFKSHDLRTWTLVGDFLAHNLPDVAYGEDISCPNFFPICDKWMLLCISHHVGCRYYIGDWDATREQFVPQTHGRLNWRRDDQSLFGMQQWRVDFFAPESVRTPDGRRVMWAWLATLGRTDGSMDTRTIQSLPRELWLAPDHTLRMAPLRELATLRRQAQIYHDVDLGAPQANLALNPAGVQHLVDYAHEAVEIRICLARTQVQRKLFGFVVCADAQGHGLPLIFRPETGTMRLGNAEAPFALMSLAVDEDLEMRIFIDQFLVEVFVNNRQSMVAEYTNDAGNTALYGITVGAATVATTVEVWELRIEN